MHIHRSIQPCAPLHQQNHISLQLDLTTCSAVFFTQDALLQKLRSVTAADMPPEAILQRFSVLQHVLALLQPADKGSSLPKAALQFLLCFVRRIKWALGMAADPDLLPSSTGQQERIFSAC